MTQQEALDVLKLGHNVYLSGSAGSGKTYLLNQYIKYLEEHGVEPAVTASTGIAATHMGGVTIHSWSGLGIRDKISDADIEAMEERPYLWKRFEKTKVLIIDEVSMLHHFRLDMVEKVCRSFKRNNLPFGGIQVVLCGDFFQLPPISRMGEPDGYFIHKSDAWKNMGLKVCYLHEQFRQKDDAFLEVLNDIRGRRVSEETLEHLRARYMQDPKYTSVRPTKLYTHNMDVDSINEIELEKLDGESKRYEMHSRGKDPLIEALKKSCLAPLSLRLKKGAQVMFVKNNFEQGYVNGTLGTVVDFDSSKLPIIETVSGKRILASPIEWRIEEEGKMLAEIVQVPLRLAWAITVHKSQGMSLDAVEVDLSKSFEQGMGYVALSRVRSLDGLKLLGMNDVALQVNPEVLEFDKTLLVDSDRIALELKNLKKSEKELRQKDFLERIAPKKGAKHVKLATHHVTKLLVHEKKTLKEISEARELKADTIIDHIEKVQEEGEELDIEYLKDEAFTPIKFLKIFEAFRKSFEKNGDYRLSPVKNLLGKGFTYDEIRLARLFVKK